MVRLKLKQLNRELVSLKNRTRYELPKKGGENELIVVTYVTRTNHQVGPFAVHFI